VICLEEEEFWFLWLPFKEKDEQENKSQEKVRRGLCF
jgi:hypothetical protein